MTKKSVHLHKEVMIYMNLDLGDSVVSKEVRKAANHHTIGGNPLISRPDYDEVKLNDMNDLDDFTGKIQVSRILEKKDKTYNTAIIEVFDDVGQEKLTLFADFDSRKEVINVNDTFERYIDFFNICKSLNVLNGAVAEDIHAINKVDTLKYLTALDSLDVVTVRVYEKSNGYNSFIIMNGEGEY